MFSLQITESDAFLDMPLSSQALYFHLSMNADDEGFVNSPKRVMRMVGASEDDLKILLTKRFLIAFPSGVMVVKHWKINNSIPNDRFKPTDYQEERAMLEVKQNKAYTECIQTVNNMDTRCIQPVSVDQSSLDKNRLDKNQSIYISKLITNKDKDRLTDLYADVDKLLELVDHRIRQRSEQTPIKNPYAYVTAIARECNWPTREEAERKASAREARFREMEDENQREIERLNRLARDTFSRSRKGETM